MYLTTPDGSSVHGDFLFDCVPPPPKEGNVYDFIKLEPGRFYGVADEIKVTDVASKPGEYDINVTYNSFASRSTGTATGLALWETKLPCRNESSWSSNGSVPHQSSEYVHYAVSSSWF
jgi:hypothetical protein